MREHPVQLGLSAFAVGLLSGSLLAPSELERRVYERAAGRVRGLLSRSREVLLTVAAEQLMAATQRLRKEVAAAKEAG